MTVSNIKSGIVQRLPGKRHLHILKASAALCRQYPQTPLYKTVRQLNLRAYFCIFPHYGPFWCKEATPNHPLYHTTERANLPSIQKNGLQNSKTRLVFLSNSLEEARARVIKKQLHDPVLLKIDSSRMCQDGFRFYVNQEWDHIWITQTVPEQYITEL